MSLQFAVSDSAREGQHVADVSDAGEVHDTALEAQAEAGMAGGAVLPEIQIEVVGCLVHAQLADAGEELVVVVLTLAAADDLADAGDQAVHGCDGG